VPRCASAAHPGPHPLHAPRSARAQIARLGHAFGDGVEHAARGLEERLLRHIAHAQALCLLQQPVVELFLPGQHLEQAGLAGAVAADQAQPLAGFERQRRAVEQRDMAIGQVGVRQRQDGHGLQARGTAGSAVGYGRAVIIGTADMAGAADANPLDGGGTSIRP
jgi:hypothetical protein